MIIFFLGVVTIGLSFASRGLRLRFPEIRSLFCSGAEPRYIPFILWVFSSMLVNIGVSQLAALFCAHYHILTRMKQTGSIALPIAVCAVFVVIAIALVILLALFFGYAGRPSGKDENASMHTRVSAKDSPANVWPPPPRP